MPNHADLSPADHAALKVLAACEIETHKALQQLARLVARERDIELPPSRPDEPRTGRHRFTRIDRPERGVVLLTC
jgi:hypothetical protein